jgi:acetyltransferase-like isoleucine patch superfamily enzyme
MQIQVDPDCTEILEEGNSLCNFWNIIRYKDGTFTLVPKNFFKTFDSNDAPKFGKFEIGKCSGIGKGSTVKYDNDKQMLKVGRYVAMGENIRFVLNGLHPTETISIFLFNIFGLPNAEVGNLGDLVIKNDVWIGDEAMILGGARIENGCIVGARSVITQQKVLEPYGIYAGNPAKLIRFRFDERIIAELLDLAWWDKPFDWVKTHIDKFQVNLNDDVGKSMEVLAELKRS